MAEKKRYWLKLDKNFLKNPHMQVIKKMPNGKDYIIFYLSLMLESIETIGHLRFSDLVPYNEEMLSAITDTNIDITRTAIKIFCELGLMEIFDDGTIYMTQVAAMTGKESESAERVRLFRERQKQLALQCNSDVTNSNDNKEKEKEKDKQRTENNNINNILPSESEVREKSFKIKKEFNDSDKEYKLASYLSRQISKRLGVPLKDEDALQKWAYEFNKMIRLDKCDIDEMKDVLVFSQKDPFWQDNIMSAGKFRKQYLTLLAKSRKEE